ncbi:VOC family protein [Paenibacillus sp. FSL R5-0766]|uniref:VOC family protein n=1 Tax=unclassified Paenibacillus TaxID=185978 RepID=UPI00096D1860|nr:VOC family protein [Paenibacillus sp. FSL R5-0765]OMF59912.1 hypothetical protein BK141_23910 [Paenibacillus sp. FSL R5-0765]
MLLHADFFVSSINDSLKFYVDALGFELVDEFEVNGDLVRFISAGIYSKCRVVLLRIGVRSAMIELIEFVDKKTDDVIKSRGSITILVPSLDEKISVLRNKGISPVSDVFNVDSNKFGRSKVLFYSDFDGNKIEFLEKV